MKTNHNNFLRLAFNIAKVNLGKTNKNPSVGCIVVRNDTVISSGITSINGRPHAEFNALKSKKNFKNCDLYTTMEPCTHYGLTPPCTNIIKEKGIKRVFYSFDDNDKRTAKKSKKKLKKENIKVYKKEYNEFKDFYKSYYLIKDSTIPFIDAKIAISKDYFTIKKKSKWITNILSRNRAHLIRSEYDAIISTSKTINKDDSRLNCRINGYDNNKPDVVIIDLDLKIKTKLSLFKNDKRKIFIVTKVLTGKKLYYLKKRGIKLIQINSLREKKDFIELFKILKKYGYNRILIETGLIFLNELLKNNFIFNLYMFQSSVELKNKGINNTSNNIIKKLKFKKKIKVNLNNDQLFKIRIR